MNDSTEKTKPNIFYAKNTDSNKSSRSNKGKQDNWKDKRKEGMSSRSSSYKPRRAENESGAGSRIESFKPNFAKSRPVKTEKKSAESYQSDSPWQKKIRDNDQTPTFTPDIRHQRKLETLIYSENSCKSVFKHRPSSIIKAFITQETAYHFKDLIEWLVNQHLGYDVVSNEQLTKMAETPHHGGICLIIKKRTPLNLTTYLDNDRDEDYVLAIDDINNPHNLGGLVRTAAFYGINGLMLRQTNLLESGAAMRVAEGGAEAISPIKTDDFLAALDIFKQRGYNIVALLPCQVKSVQATELHQASFGKKTVFVIFQQINMKLIDCADDVIYLKGNENMAALNISVATGILLSNIKK